MLKHANKAPEKVEGFDPEKQHTYCNWCGLIEAKPNESAPSLSPVKIKLEPTSQNEDSLIRFEGSCTTCGQRYLAEIQEICNGKWKF